MEKNKTGKYLKYAVGEIVLVVIGILIALQINNLNEYRKQRDTEHKVLENLKENLEMNIHQIENQLTAIHRNNQSGEIILSLISADQVNTDSLGFHFHRALLNNGNLGLSQTGYESLKNVGFEIIQNEYLQNNIVDLYDNTYLNLVRVQQWGMKVRPDWDPFVVEHFILGTRNWAPRDYNFIINNHYFNGLIAVGRAQRRFYGKRYQDALKETLRVLQLIKDELGEEGVKE